VVLQAQRRSIAVLGFQNTAGRASDAWLAAVLAEMLRTELGAGGQVRIVAGEQVAQIQTASPWATDSLSPPSAARIGRAVNADLLVLGAYALVPAGKGPSLRVDFRLQDARTGDIVFQGEQLGTPPQLFGLVANLGIALRRRLGLPLVTANEEAGVLAAMPANPDAERLYALGLERMQASDFATAKDLLVQAEAIAPRFPLIHFLLARAWGLLGYDQIARREARLALDLDHDLPPTSQLLVQASYFESERDPQQAAAAYRALSSLYPDNLDYAFQLIAALNAAARREEALAVVARLRQLPPPASDDPQIDFWQAKLLSYSDGGAAGQWMDRAVAGAAARGLKLLYAQYRLEQCLAGIYGDQPQAASARCQEAYGIFIAAGNRLEAADALRIQGDRAGAAGDVDAAMDFYQRALALLGALDDHEKSGAVLNNMATLEENQGRIAAAAAHFEQARRNFLACNDQLNVGTTLANLGDVKLERGDLRGAAAHYQAALDLGRVYEPAGGEYGYFSLAGVSLQQGDLQQAGRLAQRSLQIARARASAFAITQALSVAGDIAAAQGDAAAARQDYQQALAARQRLG
ncbi:MAG: tetratricopeptide repeat protein, partial [Terriglobales bacterium]